MSLLEAKAIAVYLFVGGIAADHGARRRPPPDRVSVAAYRGKRTLKRADGWPSVSWSSGRSLVDDEGRALPRFVVARERTERYVAPTLEDDRGAPALAGAEMAVTSMRVPVAFDKPGRV